MTDDKLLAEIEALLEGRITRSFQHDHIEAAGWADLWDYHRAPSGEGPHAYAWKDKPHRVVYDLTGLCAKQREKMAALLAIVRRQREALVFYERPLSNCNRHGPEGDAARHTLAQDRGTIARQALAAGGKDAG